MTGELERALRSKVWLDSGGYLVINQTEALVAVDINSGRYTGKKNLEETILKINVEAVGELVRQIRLRDLGGIIVVDFIDMEEKKSRQKVMAALEQELRRDRSPSKVLSVNEFGLVILTRKRVRQSLERTLCEPCPYCTGSGMVKTVATVCSEIYDEVKKLAPDVKGQGVSLRVNPEVARALGGEEALGAEGPLDPPRPRHPRAGGSAPAPGAVRRGPAVKDPGLEAYVEAIEGHLRARRGVDHILSPRDFALARGWHAAGVPLATVLVGMDRAFESATDVTSLAYCRRRVEELAAAGPGAALAAGARPPKPCAPGEVEGLLRGLLEQLEKVKAPAGAPFDPPLRKIREVQDLLAVASSPNWDYVRGKLREIDDAVSASVLQALPAEQIAEFRGEAQRAIERHRGRVDDAALADAMDRYTLQRAREKLGLIRVAAWTRSRRPRRAAACRQPPRGR